ncbi:MAG: TatD family hydrolase [Ruminococcus sp.]|nr:TatD family hydrolase [Ruminococcus sp.]
MVDEARDIHGIFDSHCHYDDKAFDGDRSELLDRLLSSDSTVEYMMHACTDLNSAEFGIKTSERYKNYYTSVGIHPECIYDGIPSGYELEIERFAKHEKVRAIGEIGLDYHYDGYDRTAQLRLFESQLEIAKSLDLPVIMHCRDAMGDFTELMRKHRPKGVVHCFSGSAESAIELQRLGLYIGFTGALTFKNSKKAKNAFMNVQSDKLLFETDCPYMAPVPFRGKRCSSELIAYVALEAQCLSGVDAQQLVDTTSQNAKRLFSIDK